MRNPTPEVRAVLDGYPDPLRERLLELRRLILETARTTEGVGELEETLKWGQPAYLTTQSGSGTTIRMAPIRGSESRYALFVHCQTRLVERFRGWFPDELTFEGNRGVVFDVADPLPVEAVGECVAAALTYHRDKRGRARGR